MVTKEETFNRLCMQLHNELSFGLDQVSEFDDYAWIELYNQYLIIYNIVVEIYDHYYNTMKRRKKIHHHVFDNLMYYYSKYLRGLCHCLLFTLDEKLTVSFDRLILAWESLNEESHTVEDVDKLIVCYEILDSIRDEVESMNLENVHHRDLIYSIIEDWEWSLDSYGDIERLRK